MTLLTDPAARRGGLPARALAAPVRVHLAALAMVLLGVMGVVGTGASFSADEGAAIIQATSLSDGGGWTVPHPMPDVDPTSVNYPLELSARGPDGRAPFGKHPLYALLLAGADRVGGVAAMVLLSMAGTLAAAGLAGALARRLDPALTRPAIWVVGLASPLLFDGYLLIAHTLGAALAAAAVLAAVVAVERRSPRLALAVAPAVAASVLLRNEALFLAAAMAAAAALMGLRRRDARITAAVVALGSVLAAAVTHVLEGLWTAGLVGSGGAAGASAPAASGSSGLVAGRVDAFVLTWLTPSYGARPLVGLALLIMLAALAVGALTVRRHPDDHRRIVGCAGISAAAAVVALLSGPRTVVPGLLLAFPLVLPGLLLVNARTLRSDAARMLAGVSILFVLGVLATQYAKGGSGEWGGRYFALVIPVAVPVLLLALRDQAARLDPAVARRAMVGLAVCMVALTMMGVVALRASHRFTGDLVAAVDRAGQTVAPTDPVMVTTDGAMPRFAWSTFDRQRWLLARPDGLDDLLGRLRSAGVARFVFVTRNLARDSAVLDRAGVRSAGQDGSASVGRWHVLVVQTG